MRAPQWQVCLALLVGASLAFAACHSGPDHAPYASDTPTPGGTNNDAGIELPPGDGSSGPPNCGGQTLPTVVNRPTLYFVIDRSGSMSSPMPNSTLTRYEAAVQAVGDALLAVGQRVRYAAAIYPANVDDAGCDPGEEIFVPQDGDAPKADGSPGLVLATLLSRLKLQTPNGSTPTAATLKALNRKLLALGDQASLVLVTDGAPNCNEQASCSSEQCIPDLERDDAGNGTCGKDFSCCDPNLFGAIARENCIDSDGTEAAVAALAKLGIGTYVVGLPGSETYAAVLDRLAQAGGHPNSGATAYYAATDTSELSAALYAIGTGVTIACDIALQQVPDDLNHLNVYFDDQVVPYDPVNGWTWAGSDHVSLVGDACATLQSGTVGKLQFVYGCQTIVR